MGPIALTTLAAFGGDELRARIFVEKYALESPQETTPQDMWVRLANGIAAMERPLESYHWFEQFYWLLSNYRMVPGGRILAAIGNPHKVTALNCYVVPSPQDSIKGIYHTAWELAETFKRGGGVGVDLSSLRPKGAQVKNAARTSTGAVSFMELFSLTTGTIGQDGRRGALMLTMSDSHPDILDFCRVKQNLTNVRFANISVRLTDQFMNAVERNDEWLLQYEEHKKVIKARQLWNELIDGATFHAEPGCLFWSTIQEGSLSDIYPDMKVVSTNPCGEQPLEPYGDCCLGSLNLSVFVIHPFTPNAHLNYIELEHATRTTVRFLDNVLRWNEEHHPLPAQAVAAKRGRRIGVGIMGLADMLCQLRLQYDSEEAVIFVDSLMARIKCWAYEASSDLAKERQPFPVFEEKHFNNAYFDSFSPALMEKMRTQGLRNVTLLTVPPTGTISILAGVTSGLEPIFDLAYTRRSESLTQEYYSVVHPLVNTYKRMYPMEEELPLYFRTAHEISPAWRIAMQAAIQKHVDQALSSTINLPHGTEAKTVSQIYLDAWKAKLKGITAYVEGSREGILISQTSGSMVGQSCHRCTRCGHIDC